jgi:hypothetical protein
MSFKLAEKPVLIEGVTFILRELTFGEEWDCVNRASHFEGPVKIRVLNNIEFGKLMLQAALVKVIDVDGKEFQIPDKAEYIRNLPARIGDALALELTKFSSPGVEDLANFQSQ